MLPERAEEKVGIKIGFYFHFADSSYSYDLFVFIDGGWSYRNNYHNLFIIYQKNILHDFLNL